MPDSDGGPIPEVARPLGDHSPMRPLPMPAAVPLTEGVIQLPDVDLWYSDTGGSGEPILLVHPFTGSGHIWGYQQPVLARAGYRVITYSRRGYRGSGTGPLETPGTSAEDLRALADRLGLDRFHILGSAAGAFIAVAFAITWPERLRTLTVACSMVLPREDEFAQLLATVRVDGFSEMPASFRELGPSYRSLNPRGVEQWEALHAQSRESRPPVNQPVGAAITSDALNALHLPTLVLSGDADLFSPPPVARAFCRLVNGSELAVMTECGHSGYWERPDQFNAALLDFLTRHRG